MLHGFSQINELTYATIDWRSSISVQAAAPSLGLKVHIDSEKHVGLLRAGLSDNLPLCDQRLSARRPGSICGINTSRVVLERWASKHFVGIEWAAWVGLVEADQVRLVQVGDADVTTWLATILIVNRHDVCECVVGATGCGDCSSKSAQGKV